MITLHKPSTCNCGCGGFREHGDRWVVIERRPKPKSSRLKCLECGWRWWSVRNYVSELPDHVEASRKGMTDEHILERIEDGTLVVLMKSLDVFSFYRGRWVRIRVRKRESNGSEYKFVEICHQSKKKSIALHRLVWMFSKRSLVPDGFDVDHIDGKAFGDSIDNLQILSASENRRKGNRFACEMNEVEF